MRHISIHPTHQRPGVVLLVVMAMLALFASVALSFVFYADSVAVSANLNRAAQVQDQPDIDPELLAAYFLNQMIYDTDNVYSAMRGWSSCICRMEAVARFWIGQSAPRMQSVKMMIASA